MQSLFKNQKEKQKARSHSNKIQYGKAQGKMSHTYHCALKLSFYMGLFNQNPVFKSKH